MTVYFFGRANTNDCQKVLDILANYEAVLDQQVNRNITFIFFSKSTLEAAKVNIMEALCIPEIKQFETYLGLLSLVGRRKKASFNYIKESVWRKLQGWEEKLLSQVGKEILIKVAVQSLPTRDEPRISS